MARKRGSLDGTPLDEAQELSKKRGAALPSAIADDLFDPPETNALGDDPDVMDLNNPDIETLAEPPLIGVKPKASDLGFGESAESFGRATSPKLYASAAQFPTAVQFRVWRWENGIPVGLGAIDAEATEEDFVRAFYDAMPRPGQGNFQFRMRPIDIRGQELGKEFVLNISEHHATVRQVREAKKREEDGSSMSSAMNQWSGRNPGGDIIVNAPPAADAGSSYAEEMGRMFEQAVESADQQNRVLRESLEMERERLREEEKTRAEERVSMAERSATTVEKMMERLMASDRQRSDEAMKSQAQHSGFMMNTLTQVFSQQQEAARQQADRMREQDAMRMNQDREFFERQRVEMETRRQREREEIEAKRRAEKEEWEARRLQEREEAERRRKLENEDWEKKRNEERDRLALEQRRWEEARRNEMESVRLEAQRREAEAERRREQEKEELRIRIERERMELEQRREQLRQEREQIRLEMEERRSREQQEFERKMALEREERERRERADRERWERERVDAERKREDERREWERREVMRREEDERRRMEIEARREADKLEYTRQEALRREQLQREAQDAERRREEDRREYERRENLRREELSREMERKKEEMAMQQKQMELQAEKDRQHAERMMEMSRMERESQREAQLQREKAEREAREQAERDRQRQHELTMKEMENAKERDREHAERMLQMSKAEKSGGLAGITELLGMDTPEVLSKIFGAGGKDGEEGSSWADTIPKVLGAVAEVAAKTMAMKAPQPPPEIVQQQQAGRRAPPPTMPNMVAVQTPEGVKLIPADALARLQAQQMAAANNRRVPVPVQEVSEEDEEAEAESDEPEESNELPDQAFRPGKKVVQMNASDWDKPTGQGATAESEALRTAPPATQDVASPGYEAATHVNAVRRAKESGMAFSAQRSARKAIRELMPKLEKATSEEWLGVVTNALVKEPAIYDYLKAVSVYVALVEARVDFKLADKTVMEMKKSGMIPDDVPYDEADYARIKGGAQ